MFKVGDIIKGTINNTYPVTNQYMTAGLVVEIYQGNQVVVRVLEHTIKDWIGIEFIVTTHLSDDKSFFELVDSEKVKKPKKLKPRVKIINEENYKYIVINDEITIAFYTDTGYGLSIKHVDDEDSEVIGKAVAQYKLTK